MGGTARLQLEDVGCLINMKLDVGCFITFA